MTDSENATAVIEYSKFENMPMFQNPDRTMLKLLGGISAYGFLDPSPIQQKAIVPMAYGRDIIAQAQSGTGKTGAFAIGSLTLIDPKTPHVQVMILSHTHELATQTADVIADIGSKMGAKVELCIGQQVSVVENMENIRRGCHVVVGTPGRLYDLLTRGSFQKDHIRLIILDEADKLLDEKFIDQVRDILNIIEERHKDIPPLQVCIFSATMTDKVVALARRVMNKPVEILVPPCELTLDGIDQYYIDSPQTSFSEAFEDKVRIIIAINGAHIIPKGIIYVNSCRTASVLRDRLNANGLVTECIHGDLKPVMRSTVIKNFRLGKTRILIATDLLARGFDVQQVKVVINFSMPQVINRKTGLIDTEAMAEYQHRIGRSGRYGRKGVS